MDRHRRMLVGLVVLVGGAVALAAEPPGRGRPIVGAIRWDAWYGQTGPVKEVERTMGPPKFHFRLPFFAKVLAEGKVSIDGDSQETMDREIAYAAGAGLKYWAFVDYWEHPQLTIARRRYEAARDKRGLRFCFIEEGSRLDRNGTKGWSRLVTFFKDDNYQKVLDGRPLLFVFGRPKKIGKKEFEQLGEAAIAAGLKRPYLVFMGWRPGDDRKAMDALGFDAVSAYAAGGQYSGEMWPYAKLTDHVRTAYWEACRRGRIPTVTFATAGWDTRPRIEHPVSWIPSIKARPDPTPPARQKPLIDAVTATPKQLARHLQDAVDWTAKNRDINPANAIIIYAWNENDEGGWLIPTLSGGTARLDAIRQVLKGEPDGSATDPGPQGVR